MMGEMEEKMAEINYQEFENFVNDDAFRPEEGALYEAGLRDLKKSYEDKTADEMAKIYLSHKMALTIKEAEVKLRKKALRVCEQATIEAFTKAEIAGMKVSKRNVSIRRTIRASAKKELGGTQGLVQSVRDTEYDDLVTETISPSRLAAWAREYDPDGLLSPDEIKQAMIDDGIPPTIVEFLNVAEMYSLSDTKG